MQSKLDELTELLKEERKKNKVQHFKQNKDVLRFIRKVGLAPGDNKVPNYVIYYVFITWCKQNWSRIWGKEELFRTMAQHFDRKRSGHQRYYLINDALNLTEEIYEKAKKYENSRQKRGKKRQGIN